jgi:hypothetical protein
MITTQLEKTGRLTSLKDPESLHARLLDRDPVVVLAQTLTWQDFGHTQRFLQLSPQLQERQLRRAECLWRDMGLYGLWPCRGKQVAGIPDVVEAKPTQS